MSSSLLNMYLPSADPSIWSLGEDEVLNFDELYGDVENENVVEVPSDQTLPYTPESKVPYSLKSNHVDGSKVLQDCANNCDYQRYQQPPMQHVTQPPLYMTQAPSLQTSQPPIHTNTSPSSETQTVPLPPMTQPSLYVTQTPSLQMNQVPSHINPPTTQINPTPSIPPNPPSLLQHMPQVPYIQLGSSHLEPPPLITSTAANGHHTNNDVENGAMLKSNAGLVTFVDLKSSYEKGQIRLQGKSEQRLDYSTSFVRIYLAQPDNIKNMEAFVERFPDAAHILKDNIGRVPLKIIAGESESWVKVNLDDAGCEVYKLSKVKGEQRNRFHIVLELLFHDNNTKERFYSGTFQVKSKPKQTDVFIDEMFDEDRSIKQETDQKRKGIKRSRMSEEHDAMTGSPESIGSTVFPEVVTDHLQATTASIDQLRITQPIQTQRGDIAYHFKLRKQSNDPLLEEGDIIGLFEDIKGGTEIKPLTCENVHDAKMAGVVSRSAWLEGKTPDDKDKDVTDVVCVIGVVKVKVRGMVTNGERIYASLTSFPGVAMPESVIKQVTSNDLTLIGQSLETVANTSPDQVNLVSCFVSILLSIQTKYTAKAVTEMKSIVMDDVDVKIAHEKRRCIRGVAWKLLLLFTFLGLLAVLFYQLYAPQTAYRYWKCRQGSTGETGEFSFINARLEKVRVYGEEFHHRDLIDKLDGRNITKKEADSSGQDHRYYLNIDRCAAGGLRSGVYGPEYFIINEPCTRAYYFMEDEGYRFYKTAQLFICSHINQGQEVEEMKKTPDSNLVINITDQTDCLHNISLQNGNASFSYISASLGKEVTAHGIQVELGVIRNKMNKTINDLIQPEVRYYFNVARCQGNGGGPEYFAIVDSCDNSYYYSSSRKSWTKYRSAEQFHCTPAF